MVKVHLRCIDGMGWLQSRRVTVYGGTRSKYSKHVVDPCEISFLYLTIRLEEGKLVTKTFLKKTAAKTLLYVGSHHPKSLIYGIPVGQFLRIRRNCSKDDDYRHEVDDLYKRFTERGYSLVPLGGLGKLSCKELEWISLCLMLFQLALQKAH